MNPRGAVALLLIGLAAFSACLFAIFTALMERMEAMHG